MTIWLALDKPPSVNNLFPSSNGPGRFRGKTYREWLTVAGQQVMLARQKPILGPVAVSITIQDVGRVDLDNHAKATIDLLVSHKLIEADNRKCLRKLTMQWGDKAMKWGCEVTVEPFT